jgi:hypothetical protein
MSDDFRNTIRYLIDIETHYINTEKFIKYMKGVG